MTDLQFFFQYNSDIKGKKKFSNLNLLRRDINTCFSINPNDLSSKLDFCALWPGTMAILAGIDLLAKFYTGNDTSHESRARFLNFVEKFIDSKFKEELYQLRNSLLHSFGLYSQGRRNRIYKFVLTQDQEIFIKRIQMTDQYFISVNILHDKFEKSIIDFHEIYPTLESYKEFNALFKKYGKTEIGNLFYQI